MTLRIRDDLEIILHTNMEENKTEIEKKLKFYIKILMYLFI